MAQSQSLPDPAEPIVQPPCPKCGVPMWLIHFSRFDAEHDLRTFECKVCQHTESAVVKFK